MMHVVIVSTQIKDNAFVLYRWRTATAVEHTGEALHVTLDSGYRVTYRASEFIAFTLVAA